MGIKQVSLVFIGILKKNSRTKVDFGHMFSSSHSNNLLFDVKTRTQII
jgi:hypothetical protein